MGFRSYVRHFRGAILGLLRPSEAWCFAAGRWFFPWCFSIRGPAAAAAKASLQQQEEKVAKIHSSSKRQKEPKASFSMGFRTYVRHFRGAALLQEEKVAKIHSSSKRQKEPKASFSMGFRTYVRHFRGAILGLLRPSEAWCFAAGRWFFPWCFSIWGLAAAAAKAPAAAGGKGSQNS